MRSENITHAHRFIPAALAVAMLWSAGAAADSGTEWGKRALRLQNQIDNAAPFHDTMWVGSHNSFNAQEWDGAYNYDPNQKNKPKEQMDHGVREVVFDVYWSSATTSMLLCHGTCSGSEKTFREGLDQIRDWLDDGNSDEVVMLKVEATKSSIDDKFSKFANQLEGALGARIYKPSHHGISSGCEGIDPTTISKQAILDAGKNVIVISTPERGCPDNGGFNEWVFSGFRYIQGDLTVHTDKFDKGKSPSDCETIKAQYPTHMQRQFDSATWLNLADGDKGTVEIRDGNVNGYMECGLNVFEMFNFNGANATTTRPWLQPQDLVWSWRSGEPNNSGGDEDCAVSGDDNRFNDRVCSERHAFACRNTDGVWQVTGGYGTFSEGDAACKKLGGTYSFAAPVNARQNKQLLSVKKTGDVVWLNYQDLSMEGQWIANSSARMPYVTVAASGSDGGSAFDDKEEMKLDLYRSAPRRVQRVVLRSGQRVDAVSLEYSGGRKVSHGGSGGSERVLALASGEYIDQYEMCIDKYNGSKRVFYLRLRTNKGHEVVGGKKSGTCSSGTYTGKHLFGFHGRAGANIDALGFYFRQ